MTIARFAPLPLLLVLMLDLSGGVWAGGSPQGSALTYQGMLRQGGAPANGTYHLRFQLWDALSGGAQIGTDIDLPTVAIDNGLFTADLDFGSPAFNGEARWLQVAVVTNGGTTVTPLLPRQPVNATPYALYALAADGPNIANLNASNLASGIIPNARLAGAYSNTVTLANPANVFAGTFSGSGAAIANLNATNLATGTLSTARLPSGGPWALTSNLNIDSNTLVIDQANNRLGIGVPDPGAKLDVQASNNSNVLFGRRTGGGLAHNLYIDSLGNGGMQLLDSTGTPRVEFANGLMYFNYGNVGIGTTAPSHAIHIARTQPSIALQDLASATNQTGYISYRNNAGTETAWVGYGTAGSPDFSIVNARTGGDILLTPFSGNVGIGTSAPAAKLHVVGTTRTTVLEITGADLAEKFPTSEPIEPGMVVVIDREHAGQLCLARSAYDRAVAGVVSGANDFAAGAILGNLPDHEESPAIALTGRVYVWCDAGEHPIEPGDSLTTSDTPGHAMKVVDHARAQGAIIGKAMTPLATGRGLVLVLVNLR